MANESPSSKEEVETGDLNVDKVIDLLAEDEPKEKKDGEEEKEEDKESDEDKQDGEVEEDEDEDDEDKDEDEDKEEGDVEDVEIDELEFELVVPARKKEILAKYPKLFKDFPYLERAYFRDQQFTELLPTLEDAKEAVEANKMLNTFKEDLYTGDTTKVLRTVKESNAESFNKLVDNYLPNLATVDKDAYFHVIGNVFKTALYNMYEEAKELKEDDDKKKDYETTIVTLNNYLFGSNKLTPPTKLVKAESSESEKEREKLKNERVAFVKQKFEAAENDLRERVDNVLKSTLDRHIDKKELMTPYVKKTAVKEALESIDGLIKNDTGFKRILDKMWERANEENFSRASLDRIKSAYLSKAKSMLPKVILKVQKEALKGVGKERKDKDRTGSLPKSRGSATSHGDKSSKGTPPRGIKTLDFLNKD